MVSRLDVLRNSLEKKKSILNAKVNAHFESVAEANGQPLNDKKCGAATFKKWERQHDSIGTAVLEVEKTERAIEWQEGRDHQVKFVYDLMPDYLKEMIDCGKLKQWGKYPRILFIDGVEKARIYFDEKTKTCSHKYVKNIPSKEQYAIFRDAFNAINALQK